ncbi:MAG TPA: FapA family protein [Spirochaetia bacterium]|mgnify:CR=1 FL=1|nr:FapA family protein [Spirochaetia bacterium]
MKTPELNGSLDIKVDSDGLIAWLVFTPGTETVSGDFVQKLLSARGITEAPNLRKVDEAFRLFAQAKDVTSVEILRGTPPIPPTPEEFEWAISPIPPELKEEADRVLRDAAQPEITRIRVEKEKVEKKVLKKSKLPFAQAKEDVVFEYQKREIKERIPVDPTVLETGWAEAETRIAVIMPAKPGRPGRNIFGKPIMPQNLTEAGIYEGAGVKRGRGELTAVVTGFVRRGVNWVDIVPFSRHLWEVKLSKDKATVLLDFTPGSPGASAPDPDEILKAALALGAKVDSLLSVAEIFSLVASLIRGGKPVVDVPLSQDEDASFSITVSEDKLTATLSIKKGRGRGKPLVLNEVGKLIQKSGLKGLNYKQIQEDLVAFYRGPATELKAYILGQGVAPQVPEKRTVTFTVPFLAPEEVEKIRERAQNLPQGSFSGLASIDEFPLSSVEGMALVKQGDVIAALTPQPKLEPGKDVFGRLIPPTAGAAFPLEALENVQLEKDALVAQCIGIADRITRGDTVCIRVRPHRDALVEVRLSPDRMEGFLTLKRSEGTGVPLSYDTVNAAIAKAGIEKGIDSRAVSEAILKANEEGEVNDALIARGLPPLSAGGKDISFKISLATGRGVTIGKDGKADFRNQDRITPITEGTLIAEILSPDTESKDGWDITGKPVSASENAPLAIEFGKNIRKEEDGGRLRLVAARSGELFYDGRTIDVNEIHTVQGNVDLKTGNVKFPGTVRVSGSVLSGFYVFAGGDIFIMEGIEASLLSAQGSVFIAQGVKGGGKAVIRAKKEIRLSFAEQATLLSVGDIHIKNACLRCQVKSNGKLVLETEKGNFVGGSARVKGGLDVMNLGGESGAKTHVSFGQDYLIKDQIESEEAEIEKVKAQIIKLDSAMHLFERGGQQVNLEKVRQEKLKLLKIIEKRSMRLFTLREKFEEHCPSEIRVRGTVYPGTIIESHGRFFEVRKKSSKLVFFFNPEVGHIQEKPLDQK